MRFRAFVAAVALAATALSGCAYRQQRAAQQAYAHKDATVKAYVGQQFPLMQDGSLKKSAYWLGLFNVLETEPIRISDQIAARGANTMIDAAQQLESGKISQQEYDSLRRGTELKVGEEFQAAKAQFEDQQRQAQQQNSAMMMQYYLQTRPVTTTCFGNTCTTR